MSRIPPSGWYVEIDNPNTGHTFRPAVIGDPQRRPRANGYPKIEIPLARNEKWRDPVFEAAPLRIWYDGDRQPIDEIEAVTLTESETVIKGRGGLQLQEQVVAEYEAKPVGEAAQSLISNNTRYTPNVDQPPTSTETNKTVQTADTNSEWTNKRLTTPSTSPLIVRSGDPYADGDVFTCAQTGFFTEVENASTQNGGGIVSDSAASNGKGSSMFDSTHYINHVINPDYEVPKGKIGLGFRFITTDSTSEPGYELELDGTTISSVNNTNWWGSNAGNSVWQTTTVGSGFGSLAANTDHTFQFDVINQSGENIILDALIVYDTRYHDPGDWSSSVDSNGYLAAPTLYPLNSGAPEAEFEDVEVVKQVTGGRIENLNANDQTNYFRVGLSNDKGASYTTSSSAPFETDFTSPDTTLRWKVRLGATGDTRSTASPTTGYKPQKLDSYRLQADLKDVPLLVDRKVNGQLIDVLNEIAGNEFIWEVRRDGGSYSVEFTQPGLRTSEARDLSITSYNSTKTTAERIQRAVVFGGKQGVRDERFTADHGTSVPISNDRLLPASETVRVPSTGRRFVRGDDYRIDYGNGAITTQADGDMTDGTEYAIDYDFKPTGSYTKDGVSDPTTKVRDLPNVTTERGCELAAERLVEILQEPQYEAEIQLAENPQSWSVVNSLDIEQVPAGKPLHLKQITFTPAGATYALANRQTISEVLADVRDDLAVVSRRV